LRADQLEHLGLAMGIFPVGLEILGPAVAALMVALVATDVLWNSARQG
jgi:hypothetical protein